MPTLFNFELPRPRSWDEFERICGSAFDLKFGVKDFSTYGRQGQKQNGVDLFGSIGCEKGLSKIVGIQCKKVKRLTKTMIDEEINKAEQFEPKLDEYYIATTDETDASIQTYALTISEERAKQNKFRVSVVFWDELASYLALDESILQKHYPQFFINSSSHHSELSADPYSQKDKLILQAYSEIFSWPVIRIIRNECFGKLVSHEVTEPIYKAIDLRDDPAYIFQCSKLEAKRQRLNERCWEFHLHFSQQSAGLTGYYEYIDIEQCKITNPEMVEHWERYILETQSLANLICDSALEILEIKVNNVFD